MLFPKMRNSREYFGGMKNVHRAYQIRRFQVFSFRKDNREIFTSDCICGVQMTSSCAEHQVSEVASTIYYSNL